MGDNVALSKRQAEVAALVARGLPDKRIAVKTGLSINTVRAHIQAAAGKVGHRGTPRHRLTLWFFNVIDEEDAA